MRKADGTFEAGNPGKPKKAKNKVTQDIRKRFQMIVENRLDTLEEDLKSLRPKDRIDAIIGLAPFFIPKLAAMELKTTERKEIVAIQIITRGEIEHGTDNDQDRLIEE